MTNRYTLKRIIGVREEFLKCTKKVTDTDS